MKHIGLLLVAGLSGGIVQAQGIFGYEGNVVNSDNVGIFAGLAVNSSAPSVKRYEGWSHTAKGATGIVPSIGVYFQKSLGSRLSLRGGFSFGYSSYAYKYSQSFDSLTENFTPVLSSKFNDYTKVKHGSGYVMPQVDLGYIIGPFSKLYLVEVRAGVGLHAYLKQASDTLVATSGSVTDSETKYTYKYHTTERAVYGQPDVWGTLAANVYVGLRWQKTTSPFLNHLSAGIQATMTFYDQYTGYSEIEYKNESYQTISRERVGLGLFNFGIRIGYSFL